MRTLLLTLTGMLFCFGLWQCKNSLANQKNPLKNKTLQKLGTQKYGSNAKYQASPAGNYVLGYQDKKSSPRQTQNKVDFFVFEVKSNAIIYTNKIEGGYVKWFSDYQLETFAVRGIMPANTSKNEFIMIYNLKNKTTVKKSTLVRTTND